ncbi:MAG: hypothetical protein JXN61_01545, partial [Sedimentisphaerales bacterium]|nr:hypothetical protein [Sedimentisphaerales bacterium]
PAVAMSCAVEAPGVPGDFEKAAGHCLNVLKKLMPVRAGSVININIPRLSLGEPKGVRVVPQSSTGFNESYVQKTNEQGQTLFQLTGDHHVVDGTPTDTTSMEEGYITITALTPDMTDHKKTCELERIEF